MSEHISGVILHWETLFQSDAAGNKMVDLITRNGMIPGIKLDKGYDTAGIPGTAPGIIGGGPPAKPAPAAPMPSKPPGPPGAAARRGGCAGRPVQDSG